MVSWIKKLFGGGPRVVPNTTKEDFIACMELKEHPWAMFEIEDIDVQGRTKVHFSWNKPFIEQINKHGFFAETEEDTVQLFFYASKMQPSDIRVGGDEPIQPTGLPALSDRANRMVT